MTIPEILGNFFNVLTTHDSVKIFEVIYVNRKKQYNYKFFERADAVAKLEELKKQAQKFVDKREERDMSDSSNIHGEDWFEVEIWDDDGYDYDIIKSAEVVETYIK